MRPGPLFNFVCLSVRLSVCLSLCLSGCVMYNIRRFYSLRELYEADFYQGSLEAGEDGLTRGTCFVSRCLELVAVA